MLAEHGCFCLILEAPAVLGHVFDQTLIKVEVELWLPAATGVLVHAAAGMPAAQLNGLPELVWYELALL